MIDLRGLLSLGCSSSQVVGIGLSESSVLAAEKQLRAVGCEVKVRGFQDPKELVLALRDDALGAAVRGVLSSSSALEEIKQAFGMDEVMRTAVLEDHGGRPFMLTPVGIDEGRTKRSRVALARSTISYFAPAQWSLKVGVLSKGRPEDAPRGKHIQKSLEEGEEIAAALAAEGHDAKHYAVLMEDAIRECDLLIAPDGVAGNLMFRSLHFVGECKAYGAPIVNMAAVFVDTSRAKADFVDSVLLAAGLAEIKKRACRTA
ncbi:MAG: methanogenesis marker protein Mmp4/MtxX [Thermoplasmata archaeon]